MTISEKIKLQQEHAEWFENFYAEPQKLMLKMYLYSWWSWEAAREATNPWMPIESAPKDGTVVTVWANGDEYKARYVNLVKRPSVLYGSEYVGWLVKGKSTKLKPTHWRHPTTPPKV